MFDYHLHSSVSWDTDTPAQDLVNAAKAAGLREICFTDHQDYPCYPDQEGYLLSMDRYRDVYGALSDPELVIRKGVEIGLTDWNVQEVDSYLGSFDFDFVIGSVHMVDGGNAYLEEFWNGKTTQQAFTRFLEHTLECVKLHSNFDVLGHLTFIAKSPHNVQKIDVSYSQYREVADEIMRELVDKGIGLEINTSASDRIGEFLPSEAYLRRYKELGGEIVTMGSDAHNGVRVGLNMDKAAALLKDIFGYVCTYQNRKPIFHKL